LRNRSQSKSVHWVYWIVRPLARIGLLANFRRIYIGNAHLIPKDAPVILAVNHPSAFLEPCLLATFLNRPIHFLARGSIFIHPFANAFLKAVHITPIYRIKDATYAQVKSNLSIFDQCADKLNEHKTLVIMPEGTTVQEKRLRPLKKATTRLVYRFWEKYGREEVYIVPIGANYSAPDDFRSEVILSVGQPIKCSAFYAQYQDQPQQASKAILDTLRTRLENQMVCIDQPEEEELIEFLFEMYRNEQPIQPFTSVFWHDEPLAEEQRIAQFVQHGPREKVDKLKKEIKIYQDGLEHFKVSDLAVAQRYQYTRPAWAVYLIGLMAWPGKWLNILPIWIADYAVERMKLNVEFRMCTLIAFCIVSYSIYYLILLSLSFVFMEVSKLINMVAFLLPVWGMIYIVWAENYQEWLDIQKGRQLRPLDLDFLADKREEILEIIEQPGLEDPTPYRSNS